MTENKMDWSLQEKLTARGWRFTSHKIDLSGAEGHGERIAGLSFEQIKKRHAEGYPVVGAKGGVQLNDDHFSLIIDADMPGLFEWLKENFPETFGKTLTTKGSKLGHFYFETDRAIKKTQIDAKKGGARAVDVLGIGGMAVMPPSPHRKVKKNYEIIDNRDPLFMPWGEIEAALLSAVSHFGLYWPDLEKKNKETIQRDGTAQLIKEKLTLFDIDTRLKPGLQSCPLPGHKNGDRNPSLSVSSDGKLWNCFSQHGGGDIFNWLEAKDGADFKTALRTLAEKAGVEINSDNLTDKFIFDKDKILRKKQFVFCKLDDSPNYSYGIFLPKEKEVYDKKGDYLGTEQVEAPVLITSKRELIEISKEFEKKYRIRFECIPSSYKLRWDLDSIEDYLHGKAKSPTAKEMFERFEVDYKKYLYFKNETWHAVHALWDLGTYFFLLFKKFPLMELRGWKGTGKNKIMAVSRLHTLNATEEMTNPSEATLFRETHEQRPTKYLDEAEKLFKIVNGKIEADDRVQLINASFQHTGRVPRQEKDQHGKFCTVWFNTYSPGMLASINGLYGATEDRAIIHITTRPKEGDTHADLWPEEDDPAHQVTRDMAYLFALQNAAEIEKMTSSVSLNATDLKDRDRDIWFPVLVLAKFISEELYTRILLFAEKQSSIKKLEGISEGSFEYKILEATKELLEKNPTSGFVLIQDITLHSAFRERPPASKTIAGILDKFGFREFKTHRRNGYGYEVTTTTFNEIIAPICPSLFPSPASPPSHFDVNDDVDCDGKVTQNDANGEIEQNDFRHGSSHTPKSLTSEGDANDGDDALGDDRGYVFGAQKQPHPSILSLRRPADEVFELWQSLNLDALDASGFGQLAVVARNNGIDQIGILRGFVRQLIDEHKIKTAEGFDLEAVSC